VDIRGLRHGALEGLEREIRAARDLEERRRAPGADLAGLRTSRATSRGFTTIMTNTSTSRCRRTLLSYARIVP
jgi:hypothetical protein